MKLGWCLIWVAAGAVMLFNGSAVADDDETIDGFNTSAGSQQQQHQQQQPKQQQQQSFVNEPDWDVEAINKPVGLFNRGVVEHRPDPEDIRRAQVVFARDQPFSLILDTETNYQADQADQTDQANQSDRSSFGSYVTQEENYPDSYGGFNGHSYQNRPPIVNQLERLVAPVPIDPSSVIRNGKWLCR